MTPSRINMPKLINLSLEPVTRWIKRRLLLAELIDAARRLMALK